MGHDNHTVMSPAHRRNQNPVSPSASLFRRSSTSTREEPDLSWVALFRRHRFLLLMLALLTFLCTVYLYFAIKLGADNCSGLTGKDEARCLKMKGKTMHGHRRMLLNVLESSFEPRIQKHSQVPTHAEVASWMNLLSEDRRIQSALVLGCSTGNNLTQYLIPRFLVSVPGIGCEESSLLEGKHEELPPTILQMEGLHDSWLFDLIICDKCSMLEFLNDEIKFWKLDRLLRQGGFVMWMMEMNAIPSSALSLEDFQQHGWSCLSRVNDMVLWQKL